ncbi:hypothetical protein FDP41_007791 [Naegleria fowleri]|uniref:Uncharacterized protein n=1 Tax=Naegleria fowleri TaxID=5763 RepID=A0A6A5C7Y2_NAEFO|nr:uncharacterized protein FDP41_007791 [Naegleria fowleri]KAF0983876.1 hypothetical protein FDP41_007791 [Naegleria fowleri]CAG4713843.1 unnamed protein product [Naegleria fowleri]
MFQSFISHLSSTFSSRPILSSVVAGVSSLLLLYQGKKYYNGGQVSADLLSKSNLKGKIVIVTGASPGGIGYETAKVLHSVGATVILAVRDEKNGNESKRLIEKENHGGSDRLVVMLMDLTDLASVKQFATEFKKQFSELDILINNAGIMMCPFATTKQNIEIQFGTNHVGHFLLTLLLLDLIKKSSIGRVINVSSLAASGIKQAETKTFASFTEESVKGDGSNLGVSVGKIYSRSKFANVLFTKKLDRELKKDSPNAASYSCHPGVVRTNLGRHLPRWLMVVVTPIFYYFTKSPLDGAQTSLHLALSPSSSLKGGNYYSDCKEKVGNPLENSTELQDRLWETSLELCQEYLK